MSWHQMAPGWQPEPAEDDENGCSIVSVYNIWLNPQEDASVTTNDTLHLIHVKHFAHNLTIFDDIFESYFVYGDEMHSATW